MANNGDKKEAEVETPTTTEPPTTEPTTTEPPTTEPSNALTNDILSDKINAGIGYFGSVLGSAWNKTSKTATEGAAFFSFATLPDDDEEDAAVNVDDLPDKAPEMQQPASFITDAINRMGLYKGKDDDIQSPDDETKTSLFGSAYCLVDKATAVVKDAYFEFTWKPSDDIDFNGVCPWVGYEKEEELKLKILSLNGDSRNFTRAPPAGVTFDFEYSPQVAATAKALLQEDPRLGKVRYELVPKTVQEDDFWRNYFYRVNLIRRSFDLKRMEEEGEKKRADPASTPVKMDDEEELFGDDEEFVSDSFQGEMSEKDAELEAELENELKEYEVVESKEEDKSQ